MSCPYQIPICTANMTQMVKIAAEMICEKAEKRHKIASFAPHGMAGGTRRAAGLRQFPRVQARIPPRVAKFAILPLHSRKDHDGSNHVAAGAATSDLWNK
jgi:hypothetical protein